MCAAQAAARGLSVLVLEKSKQPGRKVLMSGGGRCNFTNMDVTANNFISNNPHFCKSALQRYSNWEFIGKVLEYGIAYHERDLGKLFCDDSAKDILNLLLRECENHGVKLTMQSDVTSIAAIDADDGARYLLQGNFTDLRTKSLVIATGGLSIPSMGSSSFAYQVAAQFGLAVLPQRAGLVPFTFSDRIKTLCENLAGNAIDCEVSIVDAVKSKNPKPRFTEAVLFTHRGLSGPAILQLSNYWVLGDAIALNVLPYHDAKAILLEAKVEHAKQKVRSVLSKYLPKSLVLSLEALYWADDAERELGQYSDTKIAAIAELLHAWVIKPSGTEGYRTAEVTIGGVSTEELSSKTLEAKTQPGLFFIGEAVDVTGWLGGYNFQWAWSSGFAAAQYV
jgi:hypothetical protein